jgi:long-chain acyl-CoA synthetase
VRDVLFESWQRVLARNGHAVAWRDTLTGGQRTFRDLQEQLDSLPALPPRMLHMVSVKEGVLNFLTQTLRAWRDDAVLCPVEREETRVPDTSGLPSDIAHLKITSGSTGEPRCVMFRGDQLAADAQNIRATMKLDASQPNLAIISVAHSYGFSNLVLPLLLQGHPMVRVPDALPSSLRMAFAPHRENQGGYTLPAVPAMWRAWWQAGLLNGAPISLAISAGAPLPLEVERGVFEQCGLKIHNFYGSSECGGIAYDRSEAPRDDASLAGTAMDGVKLSVSDQNGCLMVQGTNVGAGYWPAADAALANARFITSDLVELRDSTVLMRGRASDAINIAGRKLNPADVEAALLACEGVKHCVVFGIPSADPARCEEAVACINAAPGVTEQKLLAAAARRLATWQFPRRLWFNNDLEPNARGKFSRAEWRARWMKEQ